MTASRRPRGRKCSAARMMACSKSLCSNSLTALALLRLPLPRKLQRSQTPEIKPGEGVQAPTQCREPVFWMAELLPDGSEHSPDPRRFGLCDLEQALKPSRFSEMGEQLVHGFLRGQFARRAPVA